MQIVTPAGVEQEVPTEDLGRWQHYSQNDELAAQKDHFIVREGIKFAGTHLLLDLWGAKHLDDIKRIEDAMRECVDTCGATLLHIHLHHFTPNGGVSGVAVLAESHISVHTWPERDYAAFDVFMCGDAKPENAVAVLKRAFHPKKMEVSEELRGRLAK
jgi:S-adenosylmethionine decarboxylase